MNCLWPGFLGVVVTKLSYPFTTTAPETVIYLWNLLISEITFMLLFTWLDRLKDVELHVQSPQWLQLASLSHGAAALREKNLWEGHMWCGCGVYLTDYQIWRCPETLNTSSSRGPVLLRSQSEGLEKFLAVVVAGFVCGAVSVVLLPALVMVSANDTSLMSQVCPHVPLKDSALKYHWGPIWGGNWSCLRANTCVSFLFQAPNWKAHAVGNVPTPHTCISM